MKKYKVIMIKEWLVKANSEQEAEGISIEKCADDPEALMPHNMEITVSDANSLPDSFFDQD